MTSDTPLKPQPSHTQLGQMLGVEGNLASKRGRSPLGYSDALMNPEGMTWWDLQKIKYRPF